MLNFNQKGVIHTLPLFILVAAVGIISYMLVSSAAPFKGGLFGSINPKPVSQAATSVGVWTNVTPANMDPSYRVVSGCSDSFGATAVLADPARPSNIYLNSNCQGIWKSTDYGQTWTYPVNTGTNGSVITNSVGNYSITAGASGQPPIIYYGAIRGPVIGLWKSVDGGVNWNKLTVNVPGAREDLGAPIIDPYDNNHLLMSPHELNVIYQSFDGGQTWFGVTLDPGMAASGSGGVFIIDTGNASTTRNTWLWQAQGTGGNVGTWRTTNGGVNWTKVETNEGAHGPKGVWQPDTSGVVYMAGVYGSNGWGVYRSTNFGQTWTHVGNGGQEATVWGTPNRVYSAYSWACASCNVDPNFQSAPQPATTGWTNTPTQPTGMGIGPASVATVFDGSNYVFVTANWWAGVWRYVEPSSGQTPVPTPTTCPNCSSPTPVPTLIPTPIPTPTPSPTPGTESAFNGPHNLPGTLQLEDYDNGGEGLAYHDTESANNGGAYRPTGGVDIQAASDTGGGFNVGWTIPGEWIKYMVNVTAAGTYNLNFRVASQGAGGTFHLEIDGVNVTGTMTVPDTSGKQIYTTITKPNINLTLGAHTLRMFIESIGAMGGAANFNYLTVTSAATPPPSPTPVPTPTIAPTPVPTPTPPAQGSVITVTAGGQSGIFNNQTVRPNMILQVNGSNKQTWSNVGGNGPTNQFLTFTYNSPVKVTHDQVRVRFTNDQYNSSTGQDVNLWVQKINIDGTNYPSNASSVYSNGVWTPFTGCSGGNKQSIELSCNGFFQY